MAGRGEGGYLFIHSFIDLSIFYFYLVYLLLFIWLEVLLKSEGINVCKYVSRFL